MKSFQETIEQSEKDLQENKKKSEQIIFCLVDKFLTPLGGNVCFLSSILFDDIKDSKELKNNPEEIRVRFNRCIPFLQEYFEQKGWKIALNFVFDFPPSQMILIEDLFNGYGDALVYFHVVPRP